jgi:hypothetical protein
MTPQPVTTRRVLLGLFVVWQLVFMVVTNFNDLAAEAADFLPKEWKGNFSAVAPDWPSRRGRLIEASRTVTDLSGKYAMLTGQEQIWSLFSGAWRGTGFVAVEFRWDDATAGPGAPGKEPVLLLSDNEPQSVESFFRWGRFRTRRVETHFEFFGKDREDLPVLSARFVGLLGSPLGQGPVLAPSTMVFRRSDREALENHVRARNDTILAYLQWRWRQYRKAHGTAGLPPAPAQVIMVFRRYHTREVDDPLPYLEGPFSLPIACWRPNVPMEPGWLPVEAYNPDHQQFVRLKAQKS